MGKTVLQEVLDDIKRMRKDVSNIQLDDNVYRMTAKAGDPFISKANTVKVGGALDGKKIDANSRLPNILVGTLGKPFHCKDIERMTPGQILQHGGKNTFVALFTRGSGTVAGVRRTNICGGIIFQQARATNGKVAKDTLQGLRRTFCGVDEMLSARQSGNDDFVGYKFVWKILDNTSVDKLKGYAPVDYQGKARKYTVSGNLDPNGSLFKVAFMNSEVPLRCVTNELPGEFMALVRERCQKKNKFKNHLAGLGGQGGGGGPRAVKPEPNDMDVDDQAPAPARPRRLFGATREESLGFGPLPPIPTQ